MLPMANFKCIIPKETDYPLVIKRGNGKSLINGEPHGKSTIISIATFDYRRVTLSLTPQHVFFEHPSGQPVTPDFYPSRFEPSMFTGEIPICCQYCHSGWSTLQLFAEDVVFSPIFCRFFFRISTTKATVLLPLSSLSHAPHILGFHKSHLSWPWIARAPKGWTSRCTSEFSGFGRRLTLVCLKLRYSTEFNGLLSSSPLKCLYKTQRRYLLYIFSICWWCNILRFLLYQRTPLVQLSNCDMDWYGSIVCLLSWVMWDSINMSNCSIPSNLELCPNGTETSILRVPDWAIDFQCWFHGYPPWRPSKKGIFVTSFFNKWLFVRVS